MSTYPGEESIRLPSNFMTYEQRLTRLESQLSLVSSILTTHLKLDPLQKRALEVWEI